MGLSSLDQPSCRILTLFFKAGFAEVCFSRSGALEQQLEHVKGTSQLLIRSSEFEHYNCKTLLERRKLLPWNCWRQGKLVLERPSWRLFFQRW